MNRILYSLLFLSLATTSLAQELDPGQIDALLTKDFSVGLNLNTSGWGGAFDYNIQKTYKYKKSFGLLLTNIHHPKEYKVLGTLGSKGYYYGKINSLVSLRPYYGGKLTLFKSIRQNGVEISYKWGIGMSIGIIKPVYVEINSIESGNLIHQPIRYDPSQHFYGQIYSRSPWSKGLGESKLAPGVFTKQGLSFTFSTFNTGLSGGEIGFILYYYPINKNELMYLQKTNNLFASLYLQFNLGKKF
ncbi:MAG TPA: hypothetical protein ENK75_01020 [Saprospiraceae bacterium]|nr:hypothetical protein [Saprospiraceae bacterium]